MSARMGVGLALQLLHQLVHGVFGAGVGHQLVEQGHGLVALGLDGVEEGGPGGGAGLL